MKFYIVTVVWGLDYTDLYLKVVLPTQLSAGNLPALSQGSQVTYAIYTTSRDAESIKSSRIYPLLSELVDIEIILIDDIDLNHNKYAACNDFHKRAIIEANKENATLVFLPPDAIWSDGSFARMAEITATGKRVMLTGTDLRVSRETFVEEFLQKFPPQGNEIISVSSRELVKLSLEHLHPFAQASCWESSTSNRWPSQINWRVNSRGLVARCFHIHPLMINPSRKDILPSITYDADYMIQACPNLNEFYIVEDSDEATCASITSMTDPGLASQILPDRRSSEIGVAAWASLNVSSHHCYFFNHKLRIHADEVSVEWETVEKQADRIAGQINLWIKLLTYSGFRFWVGAGKFIWFRLRLSYIYLYGKTLLSIIRSPQRFYQTSTYQRWQRLITKSGNH